MADGTVVVIAGQAGVEVGTERAWDMVKERQLPAILFVSMMDRQNADFEKVYQDVKAHLTPGVIPVKIAGYEPAKRRVVPATDSAYVRQRRRRWTRR